METTDPNLLAALAAHRAARGDAVYATFANYLKVQTDLRRERR